jgi:CheY-like chemotaxis protein
MSTSIVICDYSNTARKQMQRCLPDDWDVDITYACNGEDALTALRQGLGEVLFLDLAMPGMDGYETLKKIRAQDLDTMVIVVADNILPEISQKVMSLGAMDCIRKPAESDVVSGILNRYGIYRSVEPSNAADELTIESVADRTARFNAYRDLCCEASSQAADILSRLTGESVLLPAPSVSELAVTELEMALHFTQDESVSAVCQGFIAPGIAGEALLVFSDADFMPMAEILGHQGDSQIEVLTDIAGILIGVILNGLGNQLHLSFSLSHPSVLGTHLHVDELIRGDTRQETILTIEVTFEIPSKSIACDVLLLFTEGSQQTMEERIV